MQPIPLFGTPEIADSFQAQASIVLHFGDAHAFAATLPDQSVDLVITSPPYNIGKDYERRISLEEYLAMQKPVIAELVRVLRETGSLCWQVGNYVENGEVFPLDIFYYPIFKQHGLQLRNRIIWHFRHGLHNTKRFSGRYETLLWFTKSDRYTFNLDAVRVPAKYPGKRHYKGKHIGKPSGNPKGKNPSDVWEILLDDWESAFWDIPNVKANHPEKTIHPCQFPVELAERCILALTEAGQVVFDPYVGVGSSLIAAIKHERRAIGCEREAEYVTVARERIAAYYTGALRLRPLGKPIHEPSGCEKIVQVPEEWKEQRSSELQDVSRSSAAQN